MAARKMTTQEMATQVTSWMAGDAIITEALPDRATALWNTKHPLWEDEVRRSTLERLPLVAINKETDEATRAMRETISQQD